MLVDTIYQDVRTDLPWELLYADDLAIIDITSTDTQNRLESWQKVLTDNGLKINVTNTEHLSTGESPLQMNVNGDEIKNVDHFKYLGSVIDRDGTNRQRRGPSRAGCMVKLEKIDRSIVWPEDSPQAQSKGI